MARLQPDGHQSFLLLLAGCLDVEVDAEVDDGPSRKGGMSDL